jgi:hypothetical protein
MENSRCYQENIMSKQQMDYFSETISHCISLYDKKRQKNKFLALGINLTSTAFEAATTILLGLRVNADTKTRLANVALGLSASITLLNTWDAFFNHKALWLRFTVATQSLRGVQEEMEYLRSKGEFTESQIDSLHRKFKRVVLAINRDWENLRKEDREQENS